VLLHNGGFCNPALQNGACTYQCISKQMLYKTPFLHNSYMKSLEFYDNYRTSLCSVWNKTNFLRYYINSEQCMAYYSKMVEITIGISCNSGTAPFCHVLCLGMDINVMLRFMVQALQDPPLCSSTVGNTRSRREKATVFYSIVHFYRKSSEHKSGGK